MEAYAGRMAGLSFAKTWAHSLAGRASLLHSEGQEFESPWVHHPSLHKMELRNGKHFN